MIQLMIYNINYKTDYRLGSKMGCSNSNAETPSLKIINIDLKTINLYLDQLPLFIIQKIKQKFDNYCDTNFQLTENQFKVMYSFYLKNFPSSASTLTSSDNALTANNQILTKLFEYYTDARTSKLTYKKFMVKYAIISKSDTTIFSNILYFLYSRGHKGINQPMTRENYEQFVVEERKNFSFEPTKCQQSTIPKQTFQKYLAQSGFLWEDSRKRFLLLDKDDIPFDAIARGLIDMDIGDLVVGNQYYVLSNSWFERWSYYYQGISADDEDMNYKSTKMIKRRSSLPSGKQRKSFMNRSSKSRNDMSFNQNAWVIERPAMITFEDIQGEYRGELKQNIKAVQQTRIISQELWQLFKKTMPAQMEFKRTANSTTTLDLFPKSIYFLKTDENGKIIDSSLTIKQFSAKKKIKNIVNQKQNQGKQKYYFIKNFGESLWSEQQQQTALAMCSVSTRFYIVETTNRVEFIEKYFRNKRVIKNITYGDKVYSFFAFNKKIMPAYIIRLLSESKALIHYLDFNFRYEVEVDVSDIQIQQDVLAESIKKQSAKKSTDTDVFSFKGLQNIGNTCFINSVIQCLIASPILQNYFQIMKFKLQKQPLLYQMSEIATNLLANKKVSPIKLKKTIDMELELFSGNDQHDAQQFLSFLIQKLNRQIKNIEKQQQTVFQHLFKGRVESTLECLECQNVKKIQQQLSIVSLPIPQPEYNTYVIYVFPIYETKIKRVILRLHRNGKVSDYLTGFQERTGRNSQQFIFVQAHAGNSRKIINDIFQEQFKKMALTQASLSPSIQVHCFQRFRKADLVSIQQENKRLFKQKQALYFDYYNDESQKWIYGRYLQKKTKIQIMDENNSVTLQKVKQLNPDYIRPLGEKIKQVTNKKLIMRRYNDTLQKMQYFALHYMVSFPKQINYAQLQKLIGLAMNNFIINGSRLNSSSRKKQNPYFIRIYEGNKQKCIYCSSVQAKIISKAEIERCCRLTEEQMKTPIIWVAKEKNYSIYIDWTNIDEYNSDFNAVETDNLSSIAEKMATNDKIQIEQCLKLYQKPQNVEMECDKCKHKQQIRAETMKYVPNILILHMKQYRITKNMTLVKMNINLKWMEFLDITKYSVNQKGSVYELYAYVRHFGTSQSGHYTCAIKRKHPFENKKVWVNFDDESTLIMDNQQKNIDSAYLLFYKRIDMPNSAYINFTNL